MAIEMSCPSCGAANLFEDRLLGQKECCRKCGDVIEVSRADDVEEDGFEVVDYRDRPSRSFDGELQDSPLKKKKRNAQLLRSIGRLASAFPWACWSLSAAS